MLVEDTGFVGPVPVAATTVRLVGAAEYLNSRTHSPGHPVAEHAAQDTKSSPYSP